MGESINDVAEIRHPSFVGKVPDNANMNQFYNSRIHVGTWYNLKYVPPVHYTSEEQVVVDAEHVKYQHLYETGDDMSAEIGSLHSMSREDLIEFLNDNNDGYGYQETRNARRAALRRYLANYKEIHIRI